MPKAMLGPQLQWKISEPRVAGHARAAAHQVRQGVAAGGQPQPAARGAADRARRAPALPRTAPEFRRSQRTR
jgi:hypothetical protein